MDAFTEEDFEMVSNISEALKPLRVAVEALCRRDASILTAYTIVMFTLEELRQQSTILSLHLESSLRRRITDERITDATHIIRYLCDPIVRVFKRSIVKTFC